MPANPPEAAQITTHGPTSVLGLKRSQSSLVRSQRLRQVSVDLEPGRCYVLLGENGAGKSTLLRILAGLLRPSFGKIRVFGDFEPQQARARIGYMSHAPMLYDELTAQENLSYFASLYPGRPCLTPAEALRQVGLDPDLDPHSRPVLPGNAPAHVARSRAPPST